MTQLTVLPRPYGGPDAGAPPSFGSPGYPPAPSTVGSGFDARQAARALRRRWWVVVLGGALGAGGALLWSRDRDPVYLGSALVQLAPSRENLTEGLVSRDGDGGSRMLAQLGLPPLEIIRSRAVLGAVVDSEPLGLRVKADGFSQALLRDVALAPSAPLGLTVGLTFTPAGVIVGHGPAVPYGQPITTGPLRFTVTAPLDSRTRSAQPRIVVLARDAAIARVATGLRLRTREGSTLIDIAFASPDADVAQRVVNRTALAFQATAAQSAQQQVQRRRVFIGEQMARVDAQTAVTERALSAFRSRMQAFSAAEKFTNQQNDLLTLQVRERDLQSSRDLASTVLRGFERSAPGARADAARMLASTGSLGSNPVVGALVSKLVGYEASRAEITSGPKTFTAQHPEVMRFDSLIATTEAALKATLQSQTAVLDLQLRDIRAQRSARERSLRDLPDANTEESRLLQNLSVLREQGALLRSEFQKARIAEAVAVGPVEIIERETHPQTLPATDSRVVVLATLLGLTLGTAGAAVPSLSDRGLRRRADVEAALGMPVLATVPRLAFGSAARPSWRTAFARRATARPAQFDTAQRRGVALASFDVRAQPGAEAYRHLRATLFSTRYGEAPRRLLVTSALPSEGKTSVAVNLASSLALQGRRVLLIDGDLRNAKLHRILDLPATPGLSDALLGHKTPAEVLRQGAIGGLFVLTAGTPSAAASDLLGAPRLRAMLNDFAQQFEAVVIDSPPVLAVSDATVLGAQVDAVLVVVRAAQTTAAEAAEATRQLTQAGVRLAGVVFNDPDGEAEDEGRSSYYYYYAGSHG